VSLPARSSRSIAVCRRSQAGAPDGLLIAAACQRDSKHRALTRLARRGGDVAAHHWQNAPADHEAKAGAAVREATGICLEAFERYRLLPAHSRFAQLHHHTCEQIEAGYDAFDFGVLVERMGTAAD
jgi:hypothetical protein